MSKLTLPPELYRNYLRHRAEDLALLIKSLAAKDATAFHRVGHQLRGNARSFGFYDLEVLARKFETVNANNILELGPRLLAELSEWIKLATISLQTAKD